MKKIIFLIVILAWCHNNSFAQTQDSIVLAQSTEIIADSLQSPSVPLQLIFGSATLVGCFYGLGGNELFDGKPDQSMGWYPIAMPVFVGGIIGGIGELTSHGNGTYLASIGGAFVGELIGALLYSGLKKAGVGDIVAYPALTIPPIVLSMVLFNASLSTTNANEDVSVLTFPAVSNDAISMNLFIQF